MTDPRPICVSCGRTIEGAAPVNFSSAIHFVPSKCQRCAPESWVRLSSPEALSSRLKETRARVERLEEASKPPIPMLLWCPECGERHIDRGDFATKPHHTHACQECGMTWRPAVVPTVGVLFLPGFKDAEDGGAP